MDLFTQVKMAVSVKEAAEYYGLEVKRGSMVCCPFHNDRTPSMKLNEDYFYCFGCGATGDVIDLVAKLFNLSSYDAAKKLADDFGIDPDKPPAAASLRTRWKRSTRISKSRSSPASRFIPSSSTSSPLLRNSYRPLVPTISGLSCGRPFA